MMFIAGWKPRSIFDRYHIVDEKDIQERGKKLARHLANQQRLVKEGTVKGDTELSGIAQVAINSVAGNGAPGVIRTPDLLVRSQTLYPTELRAQQLRV